MSIVDKRRFITSLMIILIFIGFCTAIRTIDMRSQQQIKAIQVQRGEVRL